MTNPTPRKELVENYRRLTTRRKELVENYINEILAEAGMDFLLNLARESLEQNIEFMRDEDLLEEISNIYPHILEEEYSQS